MINRTPSTAQRSRQQQSILLPSTIIKNKWKVTNKIGQGSFGETYAATDMHTSEGVAVKVEKLDDKKMVLKQEVIVLKQLQGTISFQSNNLLFTACPYVVRYIHSGRQEHFNFLIMERLGENLAELRKQRSSGTFSMCTSLRLGMHMMEALEGIHKLGFIHRDVKPVGLLSL
jgi:tau tubulin kinase